MQLYLCSLRMKPSQGRMIFQGHNLPHSISFLKKLHSDYLMNLSSRWTDKECLKTLLKTIMRYLQAYLSREDHNSKDLGRSTLGTTSEKTRQLIIIRNQNRIGGWWKQTMKTSGGEIHVKVTYRWTTPGTERPLKARSTWWPRARDRRTWTRTPTEQCQSLHQQAQERYRWSILMQDRVAYISTPNMIKGKKGENKKGDIFSPSLYGKEKI